ncbi:MAG: MASE1 domain-containing protein [Myxococcaceae bacterium]|nr:MASE1 domain-containing protein [Myxococcaceae bacterium]
MWRSWGTWWRALGLAAAYLVLGSVGAQFVFPPQENAVFWPPSGLTLAVLLRSTPGRWPVYLAAIAGAETVQVVAHGDPLPVALSWAAANVLRTLVGAGLMRRWLGPKVRMDRVQDVAGLLLFGGLLGCAVSATLGVGAVAVFKGEPFMLGAPNLFTDWLTWWLSDMLGTILVAPLLLTWWPGHRRPLTPARWVELAVLLVLLAVVAEVIFANRLPLAVVPALPYACFPFVVWAALRLGPRGAAAATVVLVVIATWMTGEGLGPYGMLAASPGERVLSVQAFIAVASLMSVTLAALASELRMAEHVQRLVAEAGAVMAESLDYRATFPRIAERVGPELGTAMGLWVRDRSGRLEEVALLKWSSGLGERLRSEAEDLSASRTWMEPEGAVLLVPMRGQQGVVGALGFLDTDRARPFSAGELAVAEDLARRCALAVEGARHLDEAREAVAARDEFIAIAAHELRTPLTALRLRLDTLVHQLRRKPGAEEVLAKLSTATRQTTRLAQLVESLLDVGRINTRQLKLERQPVELSALVAEVADRFSEEAGRSGCDLNVTLQGGITCWADAGRLEQALLNLLSNAVKFGKGKPIDVTLARVGDVAEVRVRDRGIGIAPEALERIFGRFERAVSAREFGGLGLGLFLTRQITEAHGGRVRVESTPGEGATFILELPVAPPAVAEREVPAQGPP